MKISLLRAELARVKMERDILGKRRRISRKCKVEVRLHTCTPYGMADLGMADLGAVSCAAGQHGRVPRAFGGTRHRDCCPEDGLVQVLFGQRGRVDLPQRPGQPRTKPSRGWSGTTRPDCTRRWTMSARCSSSRTGWPHRPSKSIRESAWGTDSRGKVSLAPS